MSEERVSTSQREPHVLPVMGPLLSGKRTQVAVFGEEDLAGQPFPPENLFLGNGRTRRLSLNGILCRCSSVDCYPELFMDGDGHSPERWASARQSVYPRLKPAG